MTEKQLFYPLLSVYFSLILGDLQKEKLQIVSIFRFGHKKRGLFQCPPLGRVREELLGAVEGPPLRYCFFTGVSRTFFTAAGRFLFLGVL